MTTVLHARSTLFDFTMIGADVLELTRAHFLHATQPNPLWRSGCVHRGPLPIWGHGAGHAFEGQEPTAHSPLLVFLKLTSGARRRRASTRRRHTPFDYLRTHVGISLSQILFHY